MKEKEVLKILNKYLKKEKKIFFVSTLFLLFSSIINATYGVIIGFATENIVDKNYKESIIIFIIYFVISTFEILFFDRISRIKLNDFVNNLTEKISFDVYKKVLNKPAKFFEDQNSGELLNRINSDPGVIANSLRNVTNTFIYLSTGFLIFIYITYNSLIVGLELLIYMIVIWSMSKKYLPVIKTTQDEINKLNDSASMEVNETIRGIREVKSLGLKNSRTKDLKKLLTDIFDKCRYHKKIECNYDSFVGWLSTVTEIIVFLTIIVEIHYGNLTFGFFMAITYYIYRFTYAIYNFTSLTKEYQKLKSSIERINLIFNNENDNEIFGNLSKTDIDGCIEYKNIEFKYSNEEKNIFNNFNLLIKPNQITAIVGRSGQGKTSLFNLLLRYFDVTKGQLLIDGINIKEYDEVSFRKIISIIRQDPYLFNKTILENLSMGSKVHDLEKIREACRKAEIDDYIMSLPNKYDTLIGEGGVNLSGGQKQRLAIARALLRDSKIILFDEATSALDNQNQSKIKQAIENLKDDHTIVIVAHRLSTIEDADVIHVIDKGQIAESDTHKNLLKKSKVYKELYNEEKKA